MAAVWRVGASAAGSTAAWAGATRVPATAARWVPQTRCLSALRPLNGHTTLQSARSAHQLSSSAAQWRVGRSGAWSGVVGRCGGRRWASAGAETEIAIQRAVEAQQGVERATTLEEFEAAITAHGATAPKHGHVKYITEALDRMDQLGIKPTLSTYDNLLRVFPQNSSLLNRSLFDAIWPRDSVQVEAALNLLCRMEEEGVIPEASTNAALLRVFGPSSPPVLKCRRMAFWMRRFAFANPYRLAVVPASPTETAAAFLARVGGKDAPTRVVAAEPGLAVSTQPPGSAAAIARIQSGVLSASSLAVEGPLYAWFLGKPTAYYVFAADHPPPHRRTVLEICWAHNADALTAWVGHLEVAYSDVMAGAPLLIRAEPPTETTGGPSLQEEDTGVTPPSEKS